MALAPATAPRLLPLEVEFDAATAGWGEGDRAGSLQLPLPRLGGAAAERIFGSACPAGDREGFRLFTTENLLVGWSLQPVGADMAGAAKALYGRLLAATGGQPLCRVWNYVPQINALVGGLENYRAFNAGRAQAFQAALGPEYARALPAASAVGCRGDRLASVFVAARETPRHVENPEQVPAYRYPAEHGPLPPSFARATVTGWGGRPLAFISGTAAIKGHATVASGSFEEQVACTLDNLRLISRAAGMGDDLGAARGCERHFKIYLRHPADLPRAQTRLAGTLLQPDDHVVWLEAEICRAELGLEIEATLIGR